MSVFSTRDLLAPLRDEFAGLRNSVAASERHLMHIHNLQHAIIQEIVNLGLYSAYENLGADKTLAFEYDGVPVRMHLPTGPIDLIQRDILTKRSFFHAESLEMIRATMPMRGERVLDVGAYIGNHTVFFANICGAAEVEAFEPVRTSFRALERNARLNDAPAKLHNFALGAEAGEARAELNDANGGGSALVLGAGGGLKVAALDSLGVAPFRAMKIDVEGMAVAVLQGARRTLAAYRPSLVVEAFPHEFEAVNGLLTAMSYRRAAQTADDHVYLPE